MSKEIQVQLIEGVNSSTVGFISYSNPDMIKGLNVAFGVKPDQEEIISINISKIGIQATFRDKPEYVAGLGMKKP